MKKRTAAASQPNSQTIDLPSLTLRAEVRADSLDPDARTVEIVFSTGAPVQRYDWMTGGRYVETLSLDPKAVRLKRINNSAPFLNTHSAYDVGDVLGVIVPGSARIEKGEARAVVRFSRRPDVEPVWQDVRDGILKHVSVGYCVHKYEQTEGDDGKIPTRHAIDWEPFETSAVPMGADDDAKIRQAKQATNACVLVTRAPQETQTMDDETETVPEVKPKPDQPVRTVTDPGAPAETTEQAAARATETTDRQRGADAERVRVQGIIHAVRSADFTSTFSDQLIKDNVPLERAQTMVLDELAKRGGQDRGPRPGGSGIRVESDPSEHVRSGIINALLHRADEGHWKLTDLGRSYAHRSLLEYAELCLQARSVRTTGMSKMEIAGLALGLTIRAGMHTTSDFPLILADVANKTLRRAYEEAPQTFMAIARRVPLPDFKAVNRVQLGEAPSLDLVGEHGEFTRGTIGEGREQYQLATYGKVFAISRKALVNDDTDAFSRLTMMFGRAARHKESDLVWAQITSNPTMGDGVALFHATHANLTASGTAISVDSLGVGRAAMRNQKGLDAVQFLNLVPRFLVVPPGKETIADQYVTVVTPQEGAKVNPFQGRLAVLSEPRLQVASATAWYLFADPGQIDIVEWGVLAGEEGPVIETRIGFDVDGVELKCRHDVAAKIIDWRGCYQNAGA